MPTTGVGVGSSTAFLPLTAGGASPPPWTPLDLGADLLAFLNTYEEADVLKAGLVPAANGDDVVRVINEGAWTPDADAPAGNEPTLLVAGASRSLEFAATDRLDLFDAAISVAQVFEIWVLVKMASLAANQGIVDGVSSDTAIYFNAATTTFDAYGGANAQIGAADTSAYHLLRAQFGGASSVVQMDGGTPATADLGANTLEDGIRVGTNKVTSAPLQGSIKSVVVVGRALTAGEVADMTAWFQALP